MATSTPQANWIIPSVGTVGSFNLKAPFDKYIVTSEKYTCQGVRSLGDYIANNEDVYTNVYLANGLDDTAFDEDVDANMFIVSLQSDSGQWIYVPARYISQFPNTNGVLYHNVMLAVALGSMPVNTDYDALNAAISNLVYDALGVEPDIRQVELSQQVLVDEADHERVTTARDEKKKLKLSDSGFLQYYMNLVDKLTERLRVLEEYVKINLP